MDIVIGVAIIVGVLGAYFITGIDWSPLKSFVGSHIGKKYYKKKYYEHLSSFNNFLIFNKEYSTVSTKIFLELKQFDQLLLYLSVKDRKYVQYQRRIKFRGVNAVYKSALSNYEKNCDQLCKAVATQRRSSLERGAQLEYYLELVINKKLFAANGESVVIKDLTIDNIIVEYNKQLHTRPREIVGEKLFITQPPETNSV